MGRVLNPQLVPEYHFFQHFTHVHPDDLGRVMSGVTATLEGRGDWDHVYRIGETRVRTWGKAVAGPGPLKVVGGIVALTNQE